LFANPAGTPCAQQRSVRQPPIRRFEDLVAWQFAMELADLVDDMVRDGPASRDAGFCRQILKSSAKPAPQIAEGFMRFLPKESAYYYRVARASLGETRTHLMRGRKRGYWSDEACQTALRISQNAIDTTTGLLTSRLALIKRQESERRAHRGTGRRSR
jgi:four helix bundle protein